jgi:predicted acylesterase/phospholipase RssA
VPQLQTDGIAATRAHEAVRDSVLSRLVRRAVARGDRTLDLLLLSGGGQHGAYGVGYLRGWASRPDAPMPRWDLVSGISTGALQAPFALLGTPAALDTIAALYRAAADRIAPTFDWWFWIRRTGGVVNTSRYERSLRSTVTPALREELQAEFAQGRQLLTATTDMDLGIGRVWDLTTELGRDDAALARSHDLLYTATAIPGIFPPRLIDGHVHSDGGIIANVLPILELDDYRELAARLRTAGVDGTVRVRLYVIMNVWTHVAPRVVKPSSRGAISTRSSEILFWAAQPHALRRLQELARAVSADVPGLDLEVRIAQPAASLATQPGADKLFDKAWMQRLEQIGYEQARGAAPWDSIWSSYVRPPAR